MPAIIIPRKWLIKPKGLLSIDFSNPFSSGLVAACTYDQSGLIDVLYPSGLSVASGTAPTNMTGAGSPIGEGRAYPNLSSQTYYDELAIRGKQPNGYPTLYTNFRYNTNASSNTLRAIAKAISSGGKYVHIHTGTSNTVGVTTLTGGSRLTAYSPTLVIGKNYNVFGWFGSDLYSHMLLDGVQYDGTATSSAMSAGTDTWAMRSGVESGTTTPGNYSVYAAIFWNYQLTRGMMDEFNQNPWQIFKRNPQRLYFDVSTGLPTLTSIAASNITSSGARLTVN